MQRVKAYENVNISKKLLVTVSGRVIHKIFSADNLKKKIIIFVKILPDGEFIFLPLAT
jgi:hypothetical protein